MPQSQKADYDQRALPHYVHAVEAAGGVAEVIPLDLAPEELAKRITACQGVLLPGSPADVDPQKYNEARNPKTNPPDAARDAADELLLQDAYNLRKPVFCICYGLQSLNVWRTGALVQDIASEVHAKVNHEAGRKVAVAHGVSVDPISRLAAILSADPETKSSYRVDSKMEPLRLDVNSSHHQSADAAGVGDGLRVVATCPEDGVIEALEGTQPGHFVLAVQWHPERSYDSDAPSRALFRAFVDAAKART